LGLYRERGPVGSIVGAIVAEAVPITTPAILGEIPVTSGKLASARFAEIVVGRNSMDSG
jgi:hypothetical protein